MLSFTPRDVFILTQLYLHRLVSSSQLAKLCFSKNSYETARKRLRRLQQAGYTSTTATGVLVGRGRIEQAYFLTAEGADALSRNSNIQRAIIPTGPPHSYHKEHLLRLVDMRLSLEEAKHNALITDLEWRPGRQFGSGLVTRSTSQQKQADAMISYRYSGSEQLTILLEVDTGNLRQTRHWEPKLKELLKFQLPVWVVAIDLARISVLRNWTAPLLIDAGLKPNQCIFTIYEEVMKRGFFKASWHGTDGSIMKLIPQSDLPLC